MNAEQQAREWKAHRLATVLVDATDGWSNADIALLREANEEARHDAATVAKVPVPSDETWQLVIDIVEIRRARTKLLASAIASRFVTAKARS